MISLRTHRLTALLLFSCAFATGCGDFSEEAALDDPQSSESTEEKADPMIGRDGLKYEISMRPIAGLDGDAQLTDQLNTTVFSSTTGSGSPTAAGVISQIELLTRPRITTGEDMVRYMFEGEIDLPYDMLRFPGTYPTVAGGLFSNPGYFPLIMASRGCSVAIDALNDDVETWREYERQCLGSLDSIPAEIRNRIGVLVAKGSAKPFCSATLVAERSVLTAKHCFWGEHGNPYRYALEADKIYFVAFGSGPETKVLVRNDSLDDEVAHSGQAHDDYVELELNESFEGTFPSTIAVSELPEMPVEAYLIGSIPVTETMEEFSSSRDYVATTKAGLCAIVYVDRQGVCVYHSCQSRKSSSGAGLFVNVNGSTRLLAVHRGASDLHSPCDADEYQAELLQASDIPAGRLARAGFNVAVFPYES